MGDEIEVNDRRAVVVGIGVCITALFGTPMTNTVLPRE